MKVLHIESGRHVYGGPRQVLWLLERLPQHGVESVLVCTRDTDFAAAAEEQGVDLRAIPFGGDADIGVVHRLTRLLKHEKPDLVHVHSRRGADVWGALAARVGHRPAVLSRRVDHREPGLALRLKYPLYRRVIAISERIRQVLLSQGLAANRVVCVRSAIDVDAVPRQRDDAWRRDFGLDEEHRLIGMVAQFIERKGHRFAVEAFGRLAERHPRARLVFFGHGPLVDDVKRQAADAGLADRVIFVGFEKQLPSRLPSLDVLVHPALKEGLGVAVLQAAAAGVPVIGSRAGGIPEAVIDERNGLLVPPGDVDALTAAIDRLLEDETLRARLGACGPGWMREGFSIDAMVRGNVAVYQDVLGSAA